MYWFAEADYEDGFWIRTYIDYKEDVDEAEQVYRIEEDLVTRRDGCVWYSVILV